MDYVDVDQANSNIRLDKSTKPLKYEPTDYWYLRLYYIVLRSQTFDPEHLESYLVLEYPSYEVNPDSQVRNDCIWSVPYIARSVKRHDARRMTKPKEIIKFYQKAVAANAKIINELESFRLYHMGLTDYSIKKIRNYVEYKISPRQPDRRKCYYVDEYLISDIDQLGLINLVDPEGLHAYRYYPLQEGSQVAELPSVFDGKRLSSNVAQSVNELRLRLIDGALTVSKDFFLYEQEGLLLKFDAVGSTKELNRIATEFKSLSETGDEIADRMLFSLMGQCEMHVRSNGIAQYRMEGDGFVAALPIGSGDVIGDYVTRVICMAEAIKESLDGLYAKAGVSIAFRLCLMRGRYFFGKPAGLSTMRQDFSGRSVTRLARMEEWVKHAVDSRRPPELAVCVGEELVQQAPTCFGELRYGRLDACEKCRETDIRAVLMTRGDRP